MDHENTSTPHYTTGTAPGATVPGPDDALLWHDAKTVPLTEFSLTRKQVVAMYVAAGITVKERTVSRYAQEGTIRAQLVDAERGLKRYLFDKGSVEKDIARRLRGPGSIYAAGGEDDVDDEATAPNSKQAPSRHGATTGPRHEAPSAQADRVRDLEIEVATLNGRLTEKEKQHDEDRATLEAMRTENGQLRIGIGEYKGRASELERRLALLEAPKAAGPEPQIPDDMPQPEPSAQPSDPEPRPGVLRRWFGRK